MSSVKYEISPYLALENVNGQYHPLFPEKYLEATADLPETVCDCGCFYIVNHDTAKNVDKLIDIRPMNIHLLERNIGIDIETKPENIVEGAVDQVVEKIKIEDVIKEEKKAETPKAEEKKAKDSKIESTKEEKKKENPKKKK